MSNLGGLNAIHQSTLTANSDVQSLADNQETALKGLDTAGSGRIDKSGNYDFTGINIKGEEAMNEAIKVYCDNVNKKLDELIVKGTTTGTFSGEYTTAIDEFLTAMKNSCLTAVNSMLNFKNDLNSVMRAMEAKDKSLASNISHDANSINNAANDKESN